MLNILIPLSGKNTFKINKGNAFPRILNEINGKLLIERAAEPFVNLALDKKIIVAVPQREVERYQLGKVISLLGSDIQTCAINGNTQGAACSALLAIESLELDSPLIISSFEQVFDFDLNPYIQQFITDNVDAGVLTFEGIHPKWSFVKVSENGLVTQAAEKMPISKHAIAGLYYYKTARLFIESAQSMIRKDVKTNDVFFISPTLNEIILKEGVVKAILIDKNHYYHISDEHALEAFENKIYEDHDNIKNEIVHRTHQYVEFFNSKDIKSITALLADEFCLSDPDVSIKGKHEVLSYIEGIFSSCGELKFIAKHVFVTDELESIIEFSLTISGRTFVGTDVIRWNSNLLMTEMNAYLFEKQNG
jgi:dTDP-glucose pyrophosphorylase